MLLELALVLGAGWEEAKVALAWLIIWRSSELSLDFGVRWEERGGTEPGSEGPADFLWLSVNIAGYKWRGSLPWPAAGFFDSRLLGFDID